MIEIVKTPKNNKNIILIWKKKGNCAMNHYVTGETIRTLREKKGLTQKDLANLLMVSDKTISKWETKKGYPDIGILEQLASCFDVSIAELLTGDFITNKNPSGNMLRSVFYVCPVCGNIIHSMGESMISCCGIALPPLEAEPEDEQHTFFIEPMESDSYISIEHEMSKQHYISFIACVTSSKIELIKLYPEQNAECRLFLRGHGILYMYCNKHGLIKKRF